MAGYYFSIPYIIQAVLSPFLGFLIDKIGKRAFMIVLS
jgi:MFS-type transporter involved in bile tolerance (Atg22 family)